MNASDKLIVSVNEHSLVLQGSVSTWYAHKCVKYAQVMYLLLCFTNLLIEFQVRTQFIHTCIHTHIHTSMHETYHHATPSLKPNKEFYTKIIYSYTYTQPTKHTKKSLYLVALDSRHQFPARSQPILDHVTQNLLRRI